VFFAHEPSYRAPEGFARPPYSFGIRQPAEIHARIAAADAKAAQAAAAVDLSAGGAQSALLTRIEAQRDALAARCPGLTIGAVILSPHAEQGVAADFFSLPSAGVENETDRLSDSDVDLGEVDRAPEVEPPVPDVDIEEGVSHALHEARTDVATRGLIRDLADHPAAALTVLVAHLFRQLALQQKDGDSALAILAKATGTPSCSRSSRWTATCGLASKPGATPTGPRGSDQSRSWTACRTRTRWRYWRS
jgi:ParB family chromosome partitioning protein